MDYFRSPVLSFLLDSLTYSSLICRLDILCSLKIQMDFIQPCYMLVGDFSHLTLMMNPFLKVCNQLRRKDVVISFHVWCILHNHRVSFVRRFFGSVKHSLPVTFIIFMYTNWMLNIVRNFKLYLPPQSI